MKTKNRTKKIFFFFLCFFLLAIVSSFFYISQSCEEGRNLAVGQHIPWPAIAAHRGASYYAPEETIPSYLLACELKADYLELDVQRTKDGILFAYHDDFFKRTTNIASVAPDSMEKPVGEFTWAEIQKLDAGYWFNQAFPDRARKSYIGLKIVKMEEVLDIAKKDSRKPGIYLESKSPELYPGIEKEIVETLQKQGWLKEDGYPAQKILLQSFNLESLKKFQKLSPNIPRVYLINKKMLDEKGWDKIFQEAKETQCAAFGVRGDLANPFVIRRAHKEGFLFHFYTINHLREMFLLSSFAADGIFTDRPDIAMSYFKKESSVDIPSLLKKILKD